MRKLPLPKGASESVCPYIINTFSANKALCITRYRALFLFTIILIRFIRRFGIGRIIRLGECFPGLFFILFCFVL